MSGARKEGIAVSSEDLDRVESWIDQPGGVLKAFRASLEAGGMITEDVLKVCAAVNGLLGSGLTKDAIAVLIVEAGPKKKGGSAHDSPALSKQTVLDVLEALAGLRFHLKEDRRPKIEELPEVEARWSALSIDEKARLLELANSKRVRGGK